MLKQIIIKLSYKYKVFKTLYLKLYKPNGYEYADYLSKTGLFCNIGKNCSIKIYTNITDPYLTYIGNNVQLSACSIFAHDGSIAMLCNAYEKKLDRVGPVKILDNVYIGHQAIILPSVTIGPNSIVAAGAIVTKDVPEGSIVAGNPAKVIGSLNDLVKKLENKTSEYPWYDLIVQREGGYDPNIEPSLKKQRTKFFYGR